MVKKEPYVWSTYILPNGHFLNPENYKKDDAEWQNSLSYEHEDFYFVFLNELGFFSDRVLEDYCIKVNVTYPYVAMPNNRATPEQFLALRKLIDRRGEFEYSFDEISDRVKNGSDVFDMTAPLIIILKNSEIAVDIDSTDVNSIVKMISRAYTTGTLLTESTLNEAKEDIDSSTYYRLELINPWNENMGGIFSSIWSVINHPDNDEDSADELEDIINDLMNRHDVPSRMVR